MVENIIRQTSKKTWYKFSVYINIILFFIIAIALYFLIRDSIIYGEEQGDTWMYIVRDIVFIAVALSFIFVQFFMNIYTIIRRSL